MRIFAKGFTDGSNGKETIAVMQGDPVFSSGFGRSPGRRGMATHSSILTWRISEGGGGAWQAANP